jgi:sirohydrochlorin ferrochelatase
MTNNSMGQAVILLGHGSRVPGAARDMERIAALLGQKHGCDTVEVCFLSRLGPHLPETIEKLVGQGQTKVIVIPYFLHEGMHIRIDIPETLREEALKHPHVEFILGKRLGFDDILADLVWKRIKESETLPDVRELSIEPREKFPVPPGQCEFVPMSPDEAKKHKKAGHHH